MVLQKSSDWRIDFSKLILPKRFVVTLLLVFMAKVVASSVLYYFMNFQSSNTFWMDIARIPSLPQNTILIESLKQTPRWLYLFLGWDSAWYLSIMTKGYLFSSQSYAFAPALPAFGKVLNFLVGNPVSSLVSCSALFGVLWVPIYEAVAENYMNKQKSQWSTLLFALSPYVFLFTTVAYTEGLFLFLTLAAWYLFMKGKVVYAVVAASIAQVARPWGFLIVLPMFLWILKEKSSTRFRDAMLCFLPLVSLFLWSTYCKITSNDWLAFAHSSEWNVLYSFRFFVSVTLPKNGMQAFLTAVPYQNWFSPFSIWGTIFILPVLIWIAAKADKPLAVYSTVYYLGILVGGALLSIPRFFAVLFPVWMLLTAKLPSSKLSKLILAVASLLFFLISLNLWAGFLSGNFIA